MSDTVNKRHNDKMDQLILTELTNDARLPIATIAKRVNLSRNAVRKRIERLENDNVISQYTILRGDARPRQEKSIAIVMVDRQDRMRGSDVTSALNKIPEVRLCFVVSGKFDLIVHIEADSAERLREIISDIWELPGVVDTTTNIVLSSVIDRTSHP